tara:strand:+ start:1385 stop:1999 length:615 start_codon:yes stop_codon:yes gene_type:complete
MENFNKFLKIALWILLAFVAVIFSAMMQGCVATSKKGGKSESLEKVNTLQNEEFERNREITETLRTWTKEAEYIEEPIDPTKPMGTTTDEDGNVFTTNTKRTFKNTDTEAEKNIDTKENETGNTTTEIDAEKTESESWYQKIKIGVPWYVIFFFFFFLFLFLVFLVVAWWFSKKLKTVFAGQKLATATHNEILKKLSKLLPDEA